jgi:radical SAM superfamily enzyme YgiQ (UPF0313 family)
MEIHATPPLKVLLVNPPPAISRLSPPLGLAALAAMLRERYEVRILDLSIPSDDPRALLMKPIEEEGFNVVGITGMTYQIKSALAAARYVKARRPDTLVVLGGVHATFCSEEVLAEPGVDMVVRFEGETTLMEILDRLEAGALDPAKIEGIAYRKNGEVVETARRPLVDIDSLPYPARDLLPMDVYARMENNIIHFPDIEVMFSRGCVGDCDFCCSHAFWKKFRFRAPDKILGELADIKERFGITRFSIVDDFFTANRDFLSEFCRLVKPLKIKWSCLARADYVFPELLKEMKAAGCYLVAYGVETGCQALLDRERKRFKVDDVRRAFRLHLEAGLPTCSLVMVGHPYETRQDLEATQRLLKECKPFLVIPQFAAPFPGTRWADRICQEAGEIVNRDWDAYHSPTEPLFIPEGLDADTLVAYFRRFQAMNGNFFTRVHRRLQMEKILERPRWHPRILFHTLMYGLTGDLSH